MLWATSRRLANGILLRLPMRRAGFPFNVPRAIQLEVSEAMSSSSSDQDNRPTPPKGPTVGDIVTQAVITTATFAVVSAIAGPAVGAVAATIVNGGDGA